MSKPLLQPKHLAFLVSFALLVFLAPVQPAVIGQQGLVAGNAFPAAPPERVGHIPFSPSTRYHSGRNPLQVNPLDREDSLNFFLAHYAGPEIPMGWTGNHDDCDAGTTSQEFRAAILERVNYFRAMAGVPADIVFSDDYNSKAQAAALIMSVNRRQSHTPDESWRCYSQEAYDGAIHSNLYSGGAPYFAPDGRNVIDAYVRDSGANNESVAHRSWILRATTREMGTGDVPSEDFHWRANALYVVDSNYYDPPPQTREEYVAWPPRGYVPLQVVFPRWSFSIDGADFSNSTVAMLLDGHELAGLEIEYAGHGHVVWRPFQLHDWSERGRPSQDARFSVTIANVIVDGRSLSYEYRVIVFDPDPPTYTFLPIIVGANLDAPPPWAAGVSRSDESAQ